MKKLDPKRVPKALVIEMLKSYLKIRLIHLRPQDRDDYSKIEMIREISKILEKFEKGERL